MHLTSVLPKVAENLSRFILLRNRLSPQPFGSSIVWKIVMKRGKWEEKNSWPEFCWFGDNEKDKWLWQLWMMFCHAPVSCAVAKLTPLSNTLFTIPKPPMNHLMRQMGTLILHYLWGKGRFGHVIFSSLAVLKIPITKHLQLTEQELLLPSTRTNPLSSTPLHLHFLQHRHTSCET